MSGIKKLSATTPKTVLYCGEPCVAVPAVVAQAAGEEVEAKKVVKAGTPVSGDLTARDTAFTKATSSGTPAASNAVGVMLHDVDVTDGDENASVLLFGFVDLGKLDSDVAALITDEVKAALDGKITFLK